MAEAEELHGHSELSNDDDSDHIHFDDDHEGKKVKRTPKLNNDHHHRCNLKYYTADNHDEILHDSSDSDDDNHNFIHFDDDHREVKIKKKRVHMDGSVASLSEDDGDHKHIHFDDDHECKKVRRTPKLNHDHHHLCNLKYYTADNHDEVEHDVSSEDNYNYIQFNDDHHEVKIKKKRVRMDGSLASLSEDDGDHKHIPFDDDHGGKKVKRTPKLNHDHHHRCHLKYYTADNHDEVLDDESSEDDDNHNFIHFDDDHIRVKVLKKVVHK